MICDVHAHCLPKAVDDFLARQRIMGLLIVKDGVIQVERYQYDRKPTDRFTSQSMAKSIRGTVTRPSLPTATCAIAAT